VFLLAMNPKSLKVSLLFLSIVWLYAFVIKAVHSSFFVSFA
jgi:hypothetical protein